MCQQWAKSFLNTNLGETDGAAAASAAAFANPCKASMGAFKVERGSVSSDSSSEDGAVFGIIPYDAYLWGLKLEGE